MKTTIVLIISVVALQSARAQLPSQIRLKTGYTLLFPSPGGKGYAYKIVQETSASVLLGGEYSHLMKNRKWAWHVGFTFQDGDIEPTPNEKNLIPVNLNAPPGGFGFSVYGAPAKTVIYAGFERFINRDYKKPKKNYFSVTAGLGLAFTLNKLDNWGSSAYERYQTKKGGTVEGNVSYVLPPSFPLAPSIYSGIRYNITNKKGNEVFIIEFLVNYGLAPFYKLAIDYTLDGAPRRDDLKEKGFCFQLNFIVPLYTFRKNR